MPVLFMRLRKGRLFAGVPALAPVKIPVPPAAPRLYGRTRTLDDLARDIRPSQVTALCGPAGVGKTTLALALANHPDVSAAFPDGRAWLPLGREADVFTALGELLRQFGYEPASSTTSHSVRTICARRRSPRQRWLLLLDDVWHAGDASPSWTPAGNSVIWCSRRTTRRSWMT